MSTSSNLDPLKILSPLNRSLAYALAQGDTEAIKELMTRLEENEAPAICSYFAKAQIAYGNREWNDLALSLRYAFCYGCKDTWVSGILATLYQRCDYFEHADFILDKSGVEPTNIFIQLEMEEYEDLQKALLQPLVPQHLHSVKSTATTSKNIKDDEDDHALTFNPFKSRLPQNLPQPTWLSQKDSVFSVQNLTHNTENSFPKWLEVKSKFKSPLINMPHLDWLENSDYLSSSTALEKINTPLLENTLSIEDRHRKNPELINSWLQEGLSWMPYFKINHAHWAILINQPRLSQAKQNTRVIKGQFVLALTDHTFILAQLHNEQTKPWMFYAKDCLRSEWSSDKTFSIIFKDARKIQCGLHHTSNAAGQTLQRKFQAWIKQDPS
jgi:hypothetical protein